MITKKEDYNNVPVHYCSVDLSLKIKDVDLKKGEEQRTVSYCVVCGSTEIESSHITEWEEKHVEMYGKKYVDEGVK